MMLILAIVAAIIMLMPLALYVTGVIRDPFHPLIFVGVASYFLSPNRIIFNRESTLMLIDEGPLSAYLVVSIISVLGVYIGWYLAGRRTKKTLELNETPHDYDPGKLVACAIVCMVVANISHYFYGDITYTTEISGYARDLSRLWIAAAILTIQAMFLVSPGARIPLLGLLVLTTYPPVDRFMVYGQRGDTFRLAVLVMLAFMMVMKRPSKAVFLTGACGLALLLATLNLTRGVVVNGDAKNRFDALVKVIPEFVNGNLTRADASDEEVFGAGIVEGVRNRSRYGYGLGLTVGFVGRFLPRQFFPNKDEYIVYAGSYDMGLVRSESGLNIPSGSAPSGFAHGFAELGWACPFIWAIAGYFYRRFWNKAAFRRDVRSLGFLAGYIMAMLYMITQDLLTAEVNLVYVLVPLALIYPFARVPRSVENVPSLTY